MLDRILDYLQSQGRPKTSEQILVAVMKVLPTGAAGADSLLRSIIGDDPRFCFQDGVWRAGGRAGLAAGGPYPHAIALFVEKANQGARPLCLRCGLYRKDRDEVLKIELTPSAARPDGQAINRWLAETGEPLLVVWSNEMVRLWSSLRRACRLEWNPGFVVCLRRLAERVLARTAAKIDPESLAAELGLSPPDADHPADLAHFFGECFEVLVQRVPEEHRFPAPELLNWIDRRNTEVDFTRLAFAKEDLSGLTGSPGVYIMRNRAGDVIYVGKAGNLRRRVGTYFTSRALEDPKTARIHEQLYSLETVETPSELDALMLEMRMIRRYRPPVNLQMQVHERPARYGIGLNLVLLAARPEARQVRLYFMRDGVLAGRQSARLGSPATKSLRTRIRTTYYSASRNRRKRHETWQAQIALRWLARRRRQLNYVDIDDAGGFESALRRLNSYLLDPDRLARKVLYR